jgi:hypothetical protein
MGSLHADPLALCGEQCPGPAEAVIDDRRYKALDAAETQPTELQIFLHTISRSK